MMFARLFGETEEAQRQYLKKKILITFVCLLIDIVLFITQGEFGLTLLSAYVWGWGAMKALFGFTTIGAIFSGNAVFAVIFILAYVLIGYFFGLFCMVIGIFRFIYLLVKARQDPE